MLGEPVYWLTLILITVLGVALVVYDETRKKKSESTECKDGLAGFSPVAHIDDCMSTIDEIFSDGLIAGVCLCLMQGPAFRQDRAGARGGASDATAASSLAWISERDHALGNRVYSATRRSSLLRHVATAVTLSGDEAIWFSLPVVMALGHIATGSGPQSFLSFCIELLNDVMMCCVVEMGAKFCVQRDRPSYAHQGTLYILPGEWWSFPSGHSMRAAYLAHRLVRSPFLRAAMFGPSLASSALVPCASYVWALLVAWSRVAKGRHSPCDVLAGLLAGVLLSGLTTVIGLRAWSMARVLAGSAECIQLGVMAARPELRLTGFYIHLGLQLLWFSTQPYCAWFSISWAGVLALASTVFLSSYVVGVASSPHKPCLF